MSNWMGAKGSERISSRSSHPNRKTRAPSISKRKTMLQTTITGMMMQASSPSSSSGTGDRDVSRLMAPIARVEMHPQMSSSIRGEAVLDEFLAQRAGSWDEVTRWSPRRCSLTPWALEKVTTGGDQKMFARSIPVHDLFRVDSGSSGGRIVSDFLAHLGASSLLMGDRAKAHVVAVAASTTLRLHFSPRSRLGKTLVCFVGRCVPPIAITHGEHGRTRDFVILPSEAVVVDTSKLPPTTSRGDETVLEIIASPHQSTVTFCTAIIEITERKGG